MDKLEQFSALVCYVEDHPELMAHYSEEGKRILTQTEQACLDRDAEALATGIDDFLTLLMGQQLMRGFAPVRSEKAIEQFNSIQKPTRAVLDKMEK